MIRNDIINMKKMFCKKLVSFSKYFIEKLSVITHFKILESNDYK